MKATNIISRKSAIYCLLGLWLTLYSCSGEDGATGPAGKDGNAEVIVSDWITIKWTYKNPLEGKAFMDIPVENINSYVENGGVALMYYKNDKNARILPFKFSEFDYFDFGFGSFVKNDNYQTEAFTGFRVYFDGVPVTVNILENETEYTGLRYVLVPPSIASTTGVSSNSFADYEETMELLGLNPNQ